jgi:hypothetical protein
MMHRTAVLMIPTAHLNFLHSLVNSDETISVIKTLKDFMCF